LQNSLIKRGQEAVYRQDHQTLKGLYMETYKEDYQLNLSDIFLKLFFHACQHNRKSTIIFLFKMYFEIFSESERIALRQSFYYGKFKIKEKRITRWYDQCILPVIRMK